MTAAMSSLEIGHGYTSGPVLSIVHNPAPTMMDRAKSFGSTIWNGIRSAWGWLRRTLHLDKVIDAVRTTASTVLTKVGNALGYLGWQGWLGLGAMAVSTDTGRTLINLTLGSALRWVGRKINSGIFAVVNFLDRLGAPGHWLGDRITNLHEFFIGTADFNEHHGKPGLMARIKGWWANLAARDTVAKRFFFTIVNLVGLLAFSTRLIGKMTNDFAKTASSFVLMLAFKTSAVDLVNEVRDIDGKAQLHVVVDETVAEAEATVAGVTLTDAATGSASNGQAKQTAKESVKQQPVGNRSARRGQQPAKTTARRAVR